MGMKISISGAQGVGKTTLINELKTALPEFIFISEVVRSLIKEKNININKDGDKISQHLIFKKHRENLDNEKDLITDRSVIDAFAYTLWSYNHGKFEKKDYHLFTSYFQATYKHYTHFFYIQPEFNLVDDGVRSVDKEFQTQIHGIFMDIFKQFNIEFTLLTGDLAARKKQFLEKILVI